jgi:hypothetical protein
VALVHMIGFEDMAQVHMAPVHSVRVALTHRVVAGMVATVPVRRWLVAKDSSQPKQPNLLRKRCRR